MKLFSAKIKKQVGIDLGTSKITLYLKGRGLLLMNQQ